MPTAPNRQHPRPESPHIATIPAGTDFLGRLAAALASGELLAGGAPPDSPFALAPVTILLPTRRACRAFAEILQRRAGGGALLLPRIRALGDVDLADLALDPDLAAEYPDPRELRHLAPGAISPPVAPLDRQLILSRLVEHWGRVSAAQVLDLAPDEAPQVPGSPAMAARLADELGRLMDTIETEGVDPADIAGLVPDLFAGYWQMAVAFLKIVTETWPAILAERGAMSEAAHRDLLLDLEAERLRRHPPRHPIIAAGSTGTIPATARLLRTIAGLPNGRVVLPGLDLASDEDDWREILRAPSHPQHGMARLLAAMQAERGEVTVLDPGPEHAAGAARVELARRMLRPAETADRWAGEAGAGDPLTGPALDGLTYVAARTVEEEALAIALLLRETAERETQTAALVTPDRNLARRVQAELGRWNLHVDDSAGTPLARTPAGIFARLAADLLTGSLEPVPVLALLKHPLTRLGLPREEVRRGARLLELAIFRGIRPEPTPERLRFALAAARHAATGGTDRNRARQRLTPAEWDLAETVLNRLIEALEAGAAAAAGLGTEEAVPLAGLAAAHAILCEQLGRDEAEDPATLLAGHDGTALKRLLAGLRGEAGTAWPVAPASFPSLLATLMAGIAVRPARPAHPRLQILGLLEARLLHFDRLILGGLNEGTWPAQVKTDPWLNRPMREGLGLPAPERRIGLAAHDFAQGFAASELVLTRAEFADGDPTVPSRWLLRLDAVLQPAGGLEALARTGRPVLQLARTLDDPGTWEPASDPRPRPPVGLRPRRLSVTEIETWIRDPYAIYARHVLGLEPLDALDAGIGAADRGTLIHDALHRFFAGGVPADPGAALQALTGIGEELFAELPDAPEIRAFWWRRFLRAAEWFVAEAGQLEAGTESFTEIRGAMEIAAPAGAFRLTARADRIDCGADGSARIIDYKTGQLPTGPQVDAGFSPQLPLEAAMVLAGGFADGGVTAERIAGLLYIALSGGTPPGEIRQAGKEAPDQLAAAAMAGLARRIAGYDEQETPYLSKPHPMFVARFSPYDHLARVKEWSRAGAEGGE